MVLVEVAVIAEFVTARIDLAQYADVVVRPTSADKKRTFCAVIVEQVERVEHKLFALVDIEHQRDFVVRSGGIDGAAVRGRGRLVREGSEREQRQRNQHHQYERIRRGGNLYRRKFARFFHR